MSYIDINIIGDIVIPKKYRINYLKNYLTQNSLNIANLESPIINSLQGFNRLNLDKKKIILYSLEESINFLNAINIKAVSLANNHIFDFGLNGFDETINILNNNGIKWFGAGKDLKSSLKPLVIRDNDIKISFFGMGWDFIECVNSNKNGYGVPSLNLTNIKYLSILKKFTDFLIVYVHWDYELERYPIPYQRKLAHKMIDYGANLVIGSHPHRIQGIEKYHDGLIVYSLGNFVIPQKKYLKGYPKVRYPKFSNFSFLLNLKVTNNKILEYKIIPFYNDSFNFKRLFNESLFFKILQKLSKPIKLKNKDYRRFFKKNRVNKLLPVLTDFELINKQILTLYKIRNFFINILIKFKSLLK